VTPTVVPRESISKVDVTLDVPGASRCITSAQMWEPNMSRMTNVCIALALLTFTSGCVVYQSGEKIDPTLVARIQKSHTTRTEVEALFGPPMRVYIVDVGERMLGYTYREIYDRGTGLLVPHPGTVTRRQKLLVWIGPDGKVKDLEFTDYLTDRTYDGVIEVVKRAAVPTQPSQAPAVWYPGGED
jgi:hypothetical protein